MSIEKLLQLIMFLFPLLYQEGGDNTRGPAVTTNLGVIYGI